MTSTPICALASCPNYDEEAEKLQVPQVCSPECGAAYHRQVDVTKESAEPEVASGPGIYQLPAGILFPGYWSLTAKDAWPKAMQRAYCHKCRKFRKLPDFDPYGWCLCVCPISTSGTFTLNKDKHKSKPLPSDATPVQIEEAVELLEKIPQQTGHSPETLLRLHAKLTEKAVAIMRQKNEDYCGGDQASDPYANFRVGEATTGIKGELGILLRITDKLQRIKRYLRDDKLSVVGESFEDAILDVINYSVLMYGMDSERKQCPNPSISKSSSENLTLEEITDRMQILNEMAKAIQSKKYLHTSHPADNLINTKASSQTSESSPNS